MIKLVVLTRRKYWNTTNNERAPSTRSSDARITRFWDLWVENRDFLCAYTSSLLRTFIMDSPSY